jgi:hypothetical protein
MCGCADEPIGSPQSSFCYTLGPTTSSWITSIDVLFVIDGSASMADKAQLLEAAVVDLVRELVNPPCRSTDTGAVVSWPESPLDECPAPTWRSRRPPLDVHVGVISSSLGGHGSDACERQNDRGHLLSRRAPGFLAWDPKAEAVPPGEPDLPTLLDEAGAVTRSVGRRGCGYEAPLEAMYRFLVDPQPPESIEIVDGKATPTGVDAALLAQRADFLRPDSLLVVVTIGDENDCSVREYGDFYYALQQTTPDGSPYHLPRARQECATDPADPCCKSCMQSVNECPPDPTCETNPRLSAEEDPLPLRCFDQKRRFGIDFLYPTARYVNALTKASINPSDVSLEGSPSTPNPIFTNPRDDGRPVRSPSLVLFIGIGGVPWQDIARDPTDLTHGFKSGDELQSNTIDGGTTWDLILGDPARYAPPSDPLMRESIEPRTGHSPVVGAALAPPGSAHDANPVNGHEHDRPDELQYACVFDVPMRRECDRVDEPADGLDKDCLCRAPQGGAPLCDPRAVSRQVRARAHPGLRQLAVARGLETQGGVGSVCVAQSGDPKRDDYLYRPALAPVLDRLDPHVDGDGGCLERSLPIDEGGQVACLVIEGRNVGATACECARGRTPVPAEHAPIVDGLVASYPAPLNCFCEVPQLAGDAGVACRQSTSTAPTLPDGAPVDGWCYLDATTNPPSANPELLEQCPPLARRSLRFVGHAEAASGTALVVYCCGG